MQTEPGQVLTSLKLLSQEAQVTHRQNHSLVEGLTHMWEIGCTFLEEEIVTGLHTSLTPGNWNNLCHCSRQKKNVTNFSDHVMVRIQGRARNFLQCSPVSCKDRKWPDSSIPGFQQEATTLEAFWKKIFFIRIKIYCWNCKHTSYYLQT